MMIYDGPTSLGELSQAPGSTMLPRVNLTIAMIPLQLSFVAEACVVFGDKYPID